MFISTFLEDANPVGPDVSVAIHGLPLNFTFLPGGETIPTRKYSINLALPIYRARAFASVFVLGRRVTARAYPMWSNFFIAFHYVAGGAAVRIKRRHTPRTQAGVPLSRYTASLCPVVSTSSVHTHEILRPQQRANAYLFVENSRTTGVWLPLAELLRSDLIRFRAKDGIKILW